jgi:hypothetical protein
MFAGFDSVGQVFAGLIIGLVLHIYEIGSPIFMRLLDFLLTVVGGLITFILVRVKINFLIVGLKRN